MAIESDIISLLSQWRSRLSSTDNNMDYKCALSECIYDLQNLLNESLDYQEYVQKMIESLPSEEIEEYLFNQEADEDIA